MEVCDDKMATHIALANSGIPMPKTIPGLLCYNKEQAVREEIVAKLTALLNFPIIIKESYGSLGKGVYKAENLTELTKIMEQIKCVPHLFQEFIQESYGKDIRVIVIGNKVFTQMLRKSDVDFRSNAELGGCAYTCDLPQNYIDLCEKVAKILELDYCGIDILIEKNGNPSVCEVNSNAFWGKIEQVTKTNVAQAYAMHIINSLS
jgi:ribosomal protein S6--L-glutamate ligase/gamma-F420-2:alpha-L-glutamate ligase